MQIQCVCFVKYGLHFVLKLQIEDDFGIDVQQQVKPHRDRWTEQRETGRRNQEDDREASPPQEDVEIDPFCLAAFQDTADLDDIGDRAEDKEDPAREPQWYGCKRSGAHHDHIEKN